MRHKRPETTAILETYKKATELGINLDSASDENLVWNFRIELKSIKQGRKPHLLASVCHRLRVMGVLSDGALTPKGVKLLDELEKVPVT